MSLSLWLLILAAAAGLWASGLRLFLRSDLPARRKIVWTATLVVIGIVIGLLLPLPGIAWRFVVIVCALPVVAVADVLLFRSGRGFVFWLRACGFEVCTVFGIASLARITCNSLGIAVR